VSVVISRCFALRKQDTHSMPPLIDMADHSLDGNAEVKGQETGEVVMYAKKAVGGLAHGVQQPDVAGCTCLIPSSSRIPLELHPL
jgi:hypothetical protein